MVKPVKLQPIAIKQERITAETYAGQIGRTMEQGVGTKKDSYNFIFIADARFLKLFQLS
jgi:hypothetical protein